MEQQKKSVSVNITKHIRKYINFQGDEISREEALGISRAKGKPSIDRSETKDTEGDRGEDREAETK